LVFSMRHDEFGLAEDKRQRHGKQAACAAPISSSGFDRRVFESDCRKKTPPSDNSVSAPLLVEICALLRPKCRPAHWRAEVVVRFLPLTVDAIGAWGSRNYVKSPNTS